MKTSANGIALIKRFEGCKLGAYTCPAGVLTIGYGHTSMAGPPTVTPALVISQQGADEILRRDLKKFEDGVEALVMVSLTSGQNDALVSFAFNCGLGALAKSTLLKRVNAREFDRVPAEFMKWTKANGRELPGLVQRRRAETALWRDLSDATWSPSDEARVKPEAPKPSKTMAKSREGNAAVATGTAGAIAVASEALPAIQQGVGLLPTLTDALGRPAVIAGIVIIVMSAALWYWRRQRLQEDEA